MKKAWEDPSKENFAALEKVTSLPITKWQVCISHPFRTIRHNLPYRCSTRTALPTRRRSPQRRTISTTTS